MHEGPSIWIAGANPRAAERFFLLVESSSTLSQDGQRERPTYLDLRTLRPARPCLNQSSPERRLDPPVLVLAQQPAQIAESSVTSPMRAVRRHEEREAAFSDRSTPCAVGGDDALVRGARDRAEFSSAAVMDNGEMRRVLSRGLEVDHHPTLPQHASGASQGIDHALLRDSAQ